jgi:DNA polymerase V
MNHPLYQSVVAGSPSPVGDGEAFDLAAHLVRHPEQTFYVKVSGESMVDCGIQDGDILIVDKSAEPQASDVVVAQVGDGFTVKRFKREEGRLRLVPANPNYKPIDIDEDARICGVATFAIHRL